MRRRGDGSSGWDRCSEAKRRAFGAPSKFSDEPDFRLQILIELLSHSLTSRVDEPADIFGSGVAKVDHDVGVHVRDLRVSHAKALQTALIDEPPGADAFDFLEDGAGAGVPVEPGMFRSAPAEVLLHDAMQ